MNKLHLLLLAFVRRLILLLLYIPNVPELVTICFILSERLEKLRRRERKLNDVSE